jgi:hypothetical protein
LKEEISPSHDTGMKISPKYVKNQENVRENSAASSYKNIACCAAATKSDFKKLLRYIRFLHVSKRIQQGLHFALLMLGCCWGA